MKTPQTRLARRLLRAGGTAALVLLLAACGGGGGGGGESTPVSPTTPSPSPSEPPTVPPPTGLPTPPPTTTPPAPTATPLPGALTLDAPARLETGTAAVLATALPAGAADLRHDWDFGDGQRSTDARPSHAWAAPGTYAVRVTVRNGDGAAVSATGAVQVGAFARLAGTVCTGPAPGTGWCRQAAPAVGVFARQMRCADALRCVAVGDLGQTAATRDGGRSWRLSNIPAQTDLVKVEMPDADTVYAFPEGARTVWRSRDGGLTWVLAGSAPDFVSFLAKLDIGLGDGMVWALDADTLVGRTVRSSFVSRDGGATWTTLSMGVGQVTPDRALWTGDGQWWSNDLGATWRRTGGGLSEGQYRQLIAPVGGVGSNVALLVQEYGSGLPEPRYVLLSSRDGGASFDRTVVSRPASTPFLAQVVLRADGSGHAVCRSTSTGAPCTTAQLLRTADGGRSWAVVGPLSVDGQSYPSVALTQDREALTIGNLSRVDLLDLRGSARTTLTTDAAAGGIAFPSFDRYAGVLVSRSSSAYVEATSADGGATWTPLPLGVSGTARVLPADTTGLLFFDTGRGLLTFYGSVHDTVDGGATWRERVLAAGTSAGNELRRLDNGSLVSGGSRSVDRGASWSRLSQPPGSNSDPFFIDAKRGWTDACDIGTGSPYCSRVLQRTVDGGATWQVVAALPQGVLPQQLAFAPDAQTAVLRGLYAPPPTGAEPPGTLPPGFGTVVLWATGDGGLTWSRAQLPQASGGSGRALSLGRQQVGRGGLAWVAAIVDGRDVVLRSTDGGRTWQSVALDAAASAAAADATPLGLFNLDDRHLWAFGRSGLMLASSDSGASWRRQATGTLLNIGSVFALDPQTVWATTRLFSLTTSTGGD